MRRRLGDLINAYLYMRSRLGDLINAYLYMRRRLGISLIGLTPPQFCAYPKQGPGFSTSCELS
jgi:hypothetical protein